MSGSRIPLEHSRPRGWAGLDVEVWGVEEEAGSGNREWVRSTEDSHVCW